MPRFVILEHDYPEPHWDLMLEAGPVLRTWRLAEPPDVSRPVAATASFDHRPVYLDYEGPVSGNRGTVQRWDGGMFVWEEDTPDRISFRLEGNRLHGLALLERRDRDAWTLIVPPEQVVSGQLPVPDATNR
jgi:hypothetical protein